MEKKDFFKELIVDFQHKLPIKEHVEIERNIEIPLNSNKVVILTGVRGSGKSSLMMQTINHLLEQGVNRAYILYINFDDERLLFTKATDFEDIIDAYKELYPGCIRKKAYIFFDEVQSVDKWASLIQKIHNKITKNIFLSCSNFMSLEGKYPNPFEKITYQVRVYPLSFPEYCRYKKIDTKYDDAKSSECIKSAFDDFFYNGSFPEFINCKDSERFKRLQEHFFNIIHKDMVPYGNTVIEKSRLSRFLLIQILDTITMKMTTVDAYRRIESYVKVDRSRFFSEIYDPLRTISLLLPLYKYLPGVHDDTSNKKVHFIDNGLLNVLTRSPLDNEILLRNCVYLHLLHYYSPENVNYYWVSKRLCDFVITKEGGKEVLEFIHVCYDMRSKDVKKRLIEGLTQVASNYFCFQVTVVNSDIEEEVYEYGLFVQIVPAWKWLLQHREKMIS